jgi:putative acetyltransferase
MIQIKTIRSPGLELQAAADMFREYGNELNEDINFQNFEKELHDPLTKYGPPDGVLLIALFNGIPAGCVALHTLSARDTCEMKRLFVRPAYRSFSIGKKLSQAIINEAKTLKYKTMVLDTFKRLGPAISLYKSLGFTETEPYYNNPLTGVIYMKKDLTTAL